MKLEIDTNHLRKALFAAQRAINTRSTLPILGHVLLDAKGNTLRIAATNLEIAVSIWLPCRTETDGAIAPPAKLLTEYVNSIDAKALRLDADCSTCKLVVNAGRGRASILSLSADNFPLITEFDDSQPSTTIPADVLSGLVASTAYAAARDKSKPALQSIEVSIGGGNLKMAATDGYRLAIGTRYTDAGFATDNDSTVAYDVLIPATSLGEAERLTSLTDCESVQMQIVNNGTQTIFCFSGEYIRAELVTQLMAAKFPSYAGIIPKSASTTVKVDAQEVFSALKTASLFTRDSTQIVGLTAEAGQLLQLSASSAEMGDHHNEVDATITGDGVTINLNSTFLSHALSALDGMVTLEFTSATRPVRITDAANFTMAVIMPMHPPK